MYHSKGKEINTIIEIFVDDGVACSTDPKALDNIILHLDTEFNIVKEALDYYVGFQVDINPIIKSMFVHQTTCIKNLLKKFGMGVATAVDGHNIFQECAGSDDKDAVGVPYKEAIGSIMYAMVLTRPDIAYAASMVAQFAEKPK